MRVQSASAAGPDADARGPAGGRTASVLDPPTSPPPAEEASETAAEGPAAQANAPAERRSSSGDEQPPMQGADGVESVASRQADGEGERRRPEPALGLGARRPDHQGGRGTAGRLRLSAGGADVGGPRTEASRPPAGPPAAGRTRGPAEPARNGQGHRSRIEELSKLQSTVSRRMAESKATAPHFYLEAEVDMTRAVEARARVKELARRGRRRPVLQRHVVKACALALREHPRANGAYRDGRFELYSRVNVGIAVAARDALVVPTVFDADRKSLWEIALDSRRAGRARSARARSRRRSSPARPSPSPTSACSGSTASPR